MIVLLILKAWITIFLVETGAIIILAVLNSKYKKKIAELTKELNGPGGTPPGLMKQQDAATEKPVRKPDVRPPAVVKPADFQEEAAKPVAGSAKSPLPAVPAARVRKHFPKTDMNFFQGTAALIIGVVFVVLAGLIFATTTWHMLPNFSKIIMIFGFSGVFFGVSRIASKIFKIYKTGQAFYILGSVFLFLTILAAGYFELLGHGFTLAEQQRFNVLFAGSLITELALLAGIKQFKDRVYTNACFWGMSVTILFFLQALGLGTKGSIKGMAGYSALLILISELTGKRREDMPQYMKAGFASFAGLHFWLFGILTVTLAAIEWLTAIAGHLFFDNSTVSLSTTAVLGVTAAGIAVMALKQERQYLKVLHSVSMLLFLHYLGMCIPAGLIYQVFAGLLMTGMWFFLEKRKCSPLGSVAGAYCYTLALAVESMAVMMISFVNWNSVGELLAASASVALLTAVLVYWSRPYPGLRAIIPAALFPLTITFNGMLTQAGAGFPQYNRIVFFFLAAVVIWDVVKGDRFCISIMVIGTAAQLFFWGVGRNLPMFALLLSGYLLIKAAGMEENEKDWYEKGGCLYLLAGIFFITDHWTANVLLQMLCVTVVYAAEYTIFVRLRKETAGHRFWEVAGLVILLMVQAAFYMDASLSPVYIIPCLLVFIVFYIALYQGGSKWLHLPAALSVLPMPHIAAWRYVLTDQQLYGFTAAAVLSSLFLSRRCFPVITCGGEDIGNRRFDWFHILVVIILLPMTLAAGAGWQCAYLILMALYVLQYTAVGSLRRTAFTMAAALLVLAFWTQPFIRFPELIYREMKLIPVVLFIWFMGIVWKDKDKATGCQTILYCLCLMILITDALCSGAVVDALILEAVCLMVFLWANIRKNILWLRISGTVIAAVALYMTKGFWLSLSWWVYLLAAGLGLIVFAAVNEMKKRKE